MVDNIPQFNWNDMMNSELFGGTSQIAGGFNGTGFQTSQINPGALNPGVASLWNANGTAGNQFNSNFGNIGFKTNQINPNAASMWSTEGMFGQNGWVTPAINGAMGLGNLYMGMKQHSLAKDQFRENSALLRTNLENQSKLVNNQLNRNITEANKYNEGPKKDVDEYMSTWGVSGKLGG